MRVDASPKGHLKAEKKTPASGRAAPWIGAAFFFFGGNTRRDGRRPVLRETKQGETIMTHSALREKARDLPKSPGVYFMKNQDGEIIYIGKAKMLRSRVSQYFQEYADHGAKTRAMVRQVSDFDVILVKSEFDALVLECNLIKQHIPKYNVLLKDDKGYPYIRLTEKARYPRFSVAAARQKDAASYFGPYGGRGEVKAVIDAICKTLKLPTCSRVFPRDIGKARPCLHFHMKNCEGWCQIPDGEARYKEAVAQAVQLLEGRQNDLEQSLLTRMEEAAEALKFEQAATLRDRYQAVSRLRKRHQLVSGVMADMDAVGLYQEGEHACIVFSHFVDGVLLGQDKKLISLPIEETAETVVFAVLSQYYGKRDRLPRRILLPILLEDNALEELLSRQAGYTVKLQTPKRGEQAQRVWVANENAKEFLRQALTKEERARSLLAALSKHLSLDEIPRRIEAYDISNTGASDMVSAMTVFEDGKPKKRLYRHFLIKGQEGPDDYRAMEETVRRRVNRFLAGDDAFSPLPDLMLIDGGKTHAAVARRVLRESGHDLPVFGMVKDEKHRTRALVSPEGEEIGLVGNQSIFSFIARIQDETHNSAISFHRKRRSQSSGASVLDEIPGVGRARKAALLRAFHSVKAIGEATEEALAHVVPKPVAAQIAAFYRGPDHEPPTQRANETKEEEERQCE